MSPDAAVAALSNVSLMMSRLARVPSRVAPQAAPKLEALLRNEFAQERDPYGNPWKPLSPVTVAIKQRTGGRSGILQDKGTMLDELAIVPSSGAGLTVTLGAPYSAFHQTGTRNMPARPILPYAALPASWNAALREASEKAFGEAVGDGT